MQGLASSRSVYWERLLSRLLFLCCAVTCLSELFVCFASGPAGVRWVVLQYIMPCSHQHLIQNLTDPGWVRCIPGLLLEFQWSSISRRGSVEYQSSEIKTLMHNWSVTNTSGYVSSLFECRISVESNAIFVDKVDWYVPHFINVGSGTVVVVSSL